jgi:DNA-binding SARP family transcriptional activator
VDARSGDAATDVGRGLEFHLLGKFQVLSAGRPVRALETPSKLQDLLAHLILFSDRPHRRETIAGALWPCADAGNVRKNLRQALWQLQGILDREGTTDAPLLEVDHEWVRLHPRADIRVDVRQLEQAFQRVRGTEGDQLDEPAALALAEVVASYRGELLEGWYYDWCSFERERLKSIYLTILDKLVAYSEARQEWESGLIYGSLILRYDRAHERTHWRMMRLYYLAGDRTAALRQFESCTRALEKELGVAPGQLTVELYEQIRADRSIEDALSTRIPRRQLRMGRLLSHMRQVKRTLAYTEHLVADDIAELEAGLERLES